MSLLNFMTDSRLLSMQCLLYTFALAQVISLLIIYMYLEKQSSEPAIEVKAIKPKKKIKIALDYFPTTAIASGSLPIVGKLQKLHMK